MSFRTLLLWVAITVIGGYSLKAQPQEKVILPSSECGFDFAHKKLMQSDPAYKRAVEQHEVFARNFAKQQLLNPLSPQATIVMPVVIHIVHTGGALGTSYNPTDAQIQNVLGFLNDVYAGTYSGLEVGHHLDLGVQFQLAQRDPNCNPTNGINHVNGSALSGYVANGVNLAGTGGTDQVALKNLIRWDPTKYCNVWVVNKIDGNDGLQGVSVGGWAFFPFNATLDGVVIRAHEMQVGNMTLPHEMGHTFTLYHPFHRADGSDSLLTCPPPGDQDDFVADTDPITNPNFHNPERTGTNSCTGTLYSINTERNIMSYVINPTLFTAGQQTRLLAGANDANRVTQENSNAGIPTNMAPVCPPKIDFELSETQVTQITAQTSGCRSYKDYSFDMLIGSSPSVTATATLNINSSNATEGVDFDITTTNFAAPSKVLTFPSGSSNPQSFTVRIYHTSIVQSTRTFTLGFTVNNNGGTAQAGDGRTSLTLQIFNDNVPPHGPAVTSYSLNGNGSTPFTSAIPFSATANQLKTQFLYKATELLAAGVRAGNLTGVSFIITKHSNPSFKYKGFTIKIGATTQPALHNATLNPVEDPTLAVVYSSDYTTINGLNTFGFSSPFVWDGTSNIVVSTCYDNLGLTDIMDDAVDTYSDDNSTTNSAFVYQNVNCPTPFSMYGFTPGDYKPAISFIRSDGGTQVGGTLNTSQSEYLGPNADVYFYDPTGKLLARIKNLTTFNYGCTQVVIDRAGTGASPFWNNNTANYAMNKTFRVLPTTNSTSGQYEITLYYSQAEVNGWQTVTGQNFSGIQMAKVSGQISSVTPSDPTAGSPVIVTPVKGNVGTNSSLDFTFNNSGFSGFGAGIFGFALPVSLLDFTGNSRGNEIRLGWTTTSEVNSRTFEIERSYDGVSFTKIGTVPASGHHTGLIGYTYDDTDIPQAMNFYRLKLVDVDGHFDYSKVILIKVPLDGTIPFTLLSNPVQNSLDIQFGKVTNGKTEIRLLDLTGRIFQRWTGNISSNQRIRIPLSSLLSQGIYTLQVIQDNSQFVRKLIKE